MSLAAVAYDKTPSEKLIADVGDTSAIEIFHNQILVAVYKRAEKTAGGVILPEQVRAEDEYQSKVGVILKTGPMAFSDPSGSWAWGSDMAVGDWIFFRASDGWNTKINGVMCRILDDVRVRGRLQYPDAIW
jgi:co-chaperonin GroES (HSP10)